MSVETCENSGTAQNTTTTSNGVTTNGHDNHHSNSHKSHKSSKDKHRDKDRDKDKDKHKSSSSSSSSKHHSSHHSSSSSHKSSSKDKHRDKDRDKSKSSSSSSSKDKDHHKSSSSSSSSHHKSSSKDKERSDRESSTSSTKPEEKDRKKEHKSSSHKSSSRDKDRHHSSSKDKDSSSSKDRKDRDRHHSSSSSKKSSHRDKDKSSSKSDSKKNDHEFAKPDSKIDDKIDQPDGVGMYDIKQELEESKPYIKDEQQHDISHASSCDYSFSQFDKNEPNFTLKAEPEPELNATNSEPLEENGESDEEEDLPLSKRTHQAIEDEDESDEDIPLAKRKVVKVEEEEEENDEDDDDDVPLASRKKTEKKKKNKRQHKDEDDDDDFDSKPKKKVKKESKSSKSNKTTANNTASPTKRAKKEKAEEEEHVWRWWEEEKKPDGVKWNSLEHKGPVFAPPYEPLPKHVRFIYNGKHMKLSELTEEAATFYGRMINHDYVTKKVFNDNFFKDWRKLMTREEKDTITDLSKCNFKEIFEYFQAESEKRKSATKEEKLAKKEENEALLKEYGFCNIDGHKEKIGNFRLEPPGLFRGRGEHPKMGMIKRRIEPEDVSINCGKDSVIPTPPKGHKWKDVRHDNTVTWLATWIENVQGQFKYIMLNPSSKLKGEKDHIKYETARRLHKHIDSIRNNYRDQWKSKEMRVRQRAVAMYFIDKLALRAGNEKDEDQADTVGCCSLRVEHIQLKKQIGDKENVVVFDFLGKDSIRYYNEVEVEKRVFKNLELFMENKKEGDDLFDRLNTAVLNEHLKELMDGLTAKVFRTYNASITLQNQLDELTDPDSTVPEKLLSYNRANRAVAVLCNHQRAVPKGHEKSMENLKEKIRQKQEAIDDCESELHDLKKAAKRGSVKEKVMADKKAKQLERLKDQLKKLELQETDRDENKTIALGTSKLNYLDPRISVAWCKKNDVPIEKIFNKTQRDKFRWAIHMATEDYRF
ncbi:TOP1 family protein [Megaselia abdita]